MECHNSDCLWDWSKLISVVKSNYFNVLYDMVAFSIEIKWSYYWDGHYCELVFRCGYTMDTMHAISDVSIHVLAHLTK